MWCRREGHGQWQNLSHASLSVSQAWQLRRQSIKLFGNDVGWFFWMPRNTCRLLKKQIPCNCYFCFLHYRGYEEVVKTFADMILACYTRCQFLKKKWRAAWRRRLESRAETLNLQNLYCLFLIVLAAIFVSILWLTSPVEARKDQQVQRQLLIAIAFTKLQRYLEWAGRDLRCCTINVVRSH